MIREVVIKLDKTRFRRWQKTLKRKTRIKGLPVEDVLDSSGISFTDDYFVAIRLVNSHPPSVDAVLFTPRGNETQQVTCETLPGKFELDKRHAVVIEEGT